MLTLLRQVGAFMVQVEGLEAGYKSQQAGEIHGASGKLDPFGM